MRKEVKDCNERAQRTEGEKRDLEKRLVERHDKPPRQMQIESTNQGALDDIQQLKDEVFHIQQVNSALSRTIKVEMRSELQKLTAEKELAEKKCRAFAEKLRSKTTEFDRLVGKPMDELVRREEREEARATAISQLENDCESLDASNRELRERLFSVEEKNLDLKFEKETFDLSYARLQKRISDLEHYKLQSSQLSAAMKNKYETEIAEIQNDTAKLRGDALASQPGETVKLRKKTNKTAAELEITVEQLKRVVDKQKVDAESLKRANEGLER